VLLLAALVDHCLEDGVRDLAVLHLLPRVAHVGHLLQLFARLSVFCHHSQLFPSHHALQFLIQPRHCRLFEDPVVSFEVYFCEDVFEFLLREDASPFFLENGVLFTGSVGVDGCEDCFDSIEDVAFD